MLSGRHKSDPSRPQNLSSFHGHWLTLCLEPSVAALQTGVKRSPPHLLTSASLNCVKSLKSMRPIYIILGLRKIDPLLPLILSYSNQSIPQTATKEIQEVSLVLQLHWHPASKPITIACEVLPDRPTASPSDFILCALVNDPICAVGVVATPFNSSVVLCFLSSRHLYIVSPQPSWYILFFHLYVHQLLFVHIDLNVMSSRERALIFEDFIRQYFLYLYHPKLNLIRAYN